MSDSQKPHDFGVAEMVNKVAHLATIGLQDDEIDAELAMQAEPEGWKTLCRAFDAQPELLTTSDANWSTDAARYADSIECMLNQCKEIRGMKVKQYKCDINVKDFITG